MQDLSGDYFVSTDCNIIMASPKSNLSLGIMNSYSCNDRFVTNWTKMISDDVYITGFYLVLITFLSPTKLLILHN